MNLELLGIGLISILGQVVLLRELSVAFYGVDLIYVLSIGVWIVGSAVGAVLGRRKYVPGRAAVHFLFLLYALLLPLELVLVRSLRFGLGEVPGAFLPLHRQTLGVVLAVFPVGILLGLLFQWTAKIVAGRPGALAAAYAIESLGAVLGGIASTLLLKYGIQNFTIALFCSMAAVLLGGARTRSLSLRIPAGALALGLVGGLLLAERIDLALTRMVHPALVATRDSPYSRLTISERGGQMVLYENDVLRFDSEGHSAEELVHLSATQLNSIGRVLVLGGGLEGIVKELMAYRPSQVEVVEINPTAVTLLREYFPGQAGETGWAPAVTLHIADPRQYVQTPDKFDLIILATPDPDSGQSNRFYTREFFGQLAQLLEPGGVVALSLGWSENVWTDLLARRNGSIFRALREAFPHVLGLPATGNVLLASDQPMETRPETLSHRFVSSGAGTRLVSPAYINYLYTNDRFQQLQEVFEESEVETNSDLRPVCYRYSMLIWLSKLYPSLINFDLPGARALSSPLGALAGGLLVSLFFLPGRYVARLRGPSLVALAAFVGMLLETLLLLHYQVKQGVLYQNIGILLMVFMAGLAAGAGLVRRIAAKRETGLSRSFGRCLFGGFVTLELAYLGAIALRFDAGLLPVSLLLFLTGGLVAAVFAYAAQRGPQGERSLVSSLYAGDLIGGCAASLLGSLVLVPFLGFDQSILLLIVLSLAGILFV